MINGMINELRMINDLKLRIEALKLRIEDLQKSVRRFRERLKALSIHCRRCGGVMGLERVKMWDVRYYDELERSDEIEPVYSEFYACPRCPREPKLSYSFRFYEVCDGVVVEVIDSFNVRGEPNEGDIEPVIQEGRELERKTEEIVAMNYELKSLREQLKLQVLALKNKLMSMPDSDFISVVEGFFPEGPRDWDGYAVPIDLVLKDPELRRYVCDKIISRLLD